MSTASLSRAALRHRPSAIFLNSARLNYDQKLDYSRLSLLTNLHIHNVDTITNAGDILSLLQTHRPEIIITKEMEVPSSILQDPNFPETVKLLCEAGTGYNNLPIDVAKEKNISVCNIPTYSNESVAHMVITYIMNFSAAMFDQARMIYKERDRTNFKVFQHPIYEITDKTLGLIGGSGTIGCNVMDVALPLGMKVLISSRNDKLPPNHKYCNNPNVTVVSLRDLLQQSDFVSINCPLNKETRHSIGKKEIELMKPTAFLINTARGAIINEKELIECMKDRVIAGAGLDTQEVEPPSDDSELWTLDNVFMTPHIGWRRLETRQRLVDMTADNIEAYCKGEPINVVNIN
eukprot:CAMPEP_0203665420 /NCGR_PEP_ID=MMETSP0090-20130426/2634_1 /ASSEMBLY_ACC=CAM_ASM_001088 /TAXON_ID=426623 /ORGANISM="Chaetoceros affinis, Strain CCMP159" /LENGTH=347 /DNA_ID=CAMNT_0050528959 /DNA_START=8 /DNA_END=1051 /DNA_ORIENTATION=+